MYVMSNNEGGKRDVYMVHVRCELSRDRVNFNGGRRGFGRISGDDEKTIQGTHAHNSHN